MSSSKLLEHIQAGAVDSHTDLGELLRRCKVLAAQLGNRPLEDWVKWESNGYPKDVELPPYRQWPITVKGHFSGPFQSGIRNAVIPHASIPDEFADSTRFQCRQSIASIQESLSRLKTGTARTNLGDLFVALGMNVFDGYNCIEAWGEFSSGNLVELLNVVRNKVLDFALALSQENPQLGADQLQAISPDRVTQIFNTTVLGGIASIGGVVHQATVTTVIAGDWASLAKYLAQLGVSDSDRELLHNALDSERAPLADQSLGPKVANWIGGMVGKAASGAWQIGLDVSSQLLASAILRYYGGA